MSVEPVKHLQVYGTMTRPYLLLLIGVTYIVVQLLLCVNSSQEKANFWDVLTILSSGLIMFGKFYVI